MYGWDDQQTRDMLQATVDALTWDDRVQAFKDLNKYLTEQAVWTPIYTPYYNVGVSSVVGGYQQNVLNGMVEVLPVWVEK
jgi:peptide/nickel transport system substrate-binding protein